MCLYNAYLCSLLHSSDVQIFIVLVVMDYPCVLCVCELYVCVMVCVHVSVSCVLDTYVRSSLDVVRIADSESD